MKYLKSPGGDRCGRVPCSIWHLRSANCESFCCALARVSKLARGIHVPTAENVGWLSRGLQGSASAFELLVPFLYEMVKSNCWRNSSQQVRRPPVSFNVLRDVRGLWSVNN